MGDYILERLEGAQISPLQRSDNRESRQWEKDGEAGVLRCGTPDCRGVKIERGPAVWFECRIRFIPQEIPATLMEPFISKSSPRESSGHPVFLQNDPGRSTMERQADDGSQTIQRAAACDAFKVEGAHPTGLHPCQDSTITSLLSPHLKLSCRFSPNLSRILNGGTMAPFFTNECEEARPDHGTGQDRPFVEQ